MKRKDQFKVLMDVYERRIYLLQKYAPREYKTSLNLEQGLLMKLKQFLDKVQHMDDEKIEFILQLFILVSRSWEAFCFDNDGQKRFIQDKDFNIDEIFSLLDDFLLFVNSYFTVKKYQNDNVLNKVKKIYKKILTSYNQLQEYHQISKILSCILRNRHLMNFMIYHFILFQDIKANQYISAVVQEIIRIIKCILNGPLLKGYIIGQSRIIIHF